MSLPPQNLEAERAVIGTLLITPNKYYEIELTADDFYSETHRKIWDTVTELIRKGNQVDALIVADALNVEAGIVLDIAGSIISTANIKYYADIVRDKAIRREIRTRCYDAISRHDDADLGELIASLRIDIGSREKKVRHIRDVAWDVFTQIEKRAENADGISGVPTGFFELDRITDGFQGGDFIIIAGRPSMGKSAFAGEIALNSKSHIVTIEMTSGGIVKRWLSKFSDFDLWRFKHSYQFQKEDWSRLRRATGDLRQFDITFDETALKVSEIERSITESALRGAQIAVVDYLQLIKGDGGRKTREREIGEISTSLKGLAKKLKIPIIAVAQLSRAVEQRENKRPMLSDLRDSGQIEQDADIILFLYREHYYNKGADPCEAECIAAKGRETGTGSFKLKFDPKKASFYDMPI